MKRIFAAALAAAMMLSLASCANKEDADDSDCIYGRIESIEGNDVVLELAKKNENTADSGSDDSEAEDDSSEGGKSGKRSRPQNGEMPEGFDPSQFGSMPEGFDGSLPDGFDPSQFGNFDPSQFKGRGSDDSGSSRRQRPEGFDGSLPDDFDPSQFGGNMPGGFDPSQFDGSLPDGFDGSLPDGFDGSLPDGFDPSQFGGKMPSGFGKSGGSKGSSGTVIGGYTLTGEQKELRIPVGVTVTTSSGVKTAFDAIEEGDMIKCRIEKDSDGNEVVTEVWILEQ